MYAMRGWSAGCAFSRFVERLSLFIAALLVVEMGQVVEDYDDIGVLHAECLLVDSKGRACRVAPPRPTGPAPHTARPSGRGSRQFRDRRRATSFPAFQARACTRARPRPAGPAPYKAKPAKPPCRLFRDAVHLQSAR